MKIVKAMTIVSIMLFTLLVFSCKEEDVNKLNLLQQQDWEQLGQLAWDSSYTEHKFFYILRFNPDYSYYMETNWSFNGVLMYTETGIYEYDEGDGRIIFPRAIDTIDQGSVYTRVYLSPWQILQLDDTLLVVRSEPDYQPPDDPGGQCRYEDDTLYFRPK
jgi:hypothetical protein